MEMTGGKVLKTFTPSGYVDPAMGGVSLNAGYDPGFDDGILEAMIWSIVSREAGRVLAGDNPRTKRPRSRSKPGTDDERHVDHEL